MNKANAKGAKRYLTIVPAVLIAVLLFKVGTATSAAPPPYFESFQVSISENGDYLAATGFGFSPSPDLLYLFNLKDNLLSWTYEVRKCWHHAVSISADGSHLAVCSAWTGSGDNYVNFVHVAIFERGSNNPIWTSVKQVPVDITLIDPTVQVCISADGSTIAVGTTELYLFSKQDNTSLWSYPEYVSSLGMSSNGDYIAVVTTDGLCFFSSGSNVPLWTYENVALLCISADGNYVAASTTDTLHLFGREDNIPIWSYKTEVNSLSISADGKYIAVGTPTNVLIFDKEENVPFWTYSLDSTFLSLSKTENYLVVGHTHGEHGEGHGFLYFFDFGQDNTLLWYQDTGEILSVSTSSDCASIAVFTSERGKGGYLSIFDNDGEKKLEYFIELEGYGGGSYSGIAFQFFSCLLGFIGIIPMLVSACAVYFMKNPSKILKLLSFIALISAAFLLPYAFVALEESVSVGITRIYPLFFIMTVGALASFTSVMWAVRNRPKIVRFVMPLVVLVVWAVIFTMFSVVTYIS